MPNIIDNLETCNCECGSDMTSRPLGGFDANNVKSLCDYDII
ncbi:MAG: hypothetical protein G01um101418_453 [Parcubacteria group bacterium Gr01-1014_18]|nr:MAG: hypothetical protein Greene041636_498 [Parcubacteria group bacterium Greene0416_36]TSC81040.1 MAG: hypothetical protein G01um101418_453 [Parcubacteria group bacterium Gr01-1014_18]TSC98962.1 MAG: hypothetical protein Greene101420_474 [Parcubacteria group bacterium Greene1014_20]TSD06746.1 MAG: hypothetical protein Greene07142_667 [Parcubacteria group bacterium Greene0714_2]